MGYKNERLLQFLPWARNFARACASKLPSHLDRDDLQSAGVLGYIRAAGRYDVSKGASFRGYCAVRTKGAVLDELRKWDWTPRSIHKNRRRITCVTSQLIDQLDREPTHSEVAAALGIEPGEFAAFQTDNQNRQLVSFDELSENLNGDESLALTERLADPHGTRPDEAVLNAEDRRTLLKCLRKLPKTEATVVVLHYLRNVPMRDIARALSVTPSRISQLHHQALGRLKQNWHRAETCDPVGW
jgi:RNA polymerase sigma factor for flagellar operon FliA